MGPKTKAESGSSEGSDSDSGSESSDSKSGESGSESHSENNASQNKSVTTSNTSGNHGNHNRTTSVSEDGKALVTESDSQDDGFTRKKNNIKEILRTAAEQPDLYGVRRSSRARKEVERYVEDEPQKKTRAGKKSGRTKSQQSWGSDSDDDESGESESSEFSDGFKPTTKRVTRKPARKRGGRPRAAAKKATTRRTRRNTSSVDESESETSDSDSKPRKAPRGAKRGCAADKTISYKEESEGATDSSDIVEVDYPEEEENNAETIEKVLNSRRGKVGATGSRTTFYNVLDQGDPNSSFDATVDEAESQFYIKWKSWSHIHNTWESEKALREQKVNGLKKLENFQKKEAEINRWKAMASPEDVEYYACQQEVMEDLISKYTTVERIITHTVPKNPSEVNGFPEYLIKWDGLPYSECTWEDGQLITNKFHSAIVDYNLRCKSVKVPSKICKVLKYRPKFQTLKAQPEFIGHGGVGEDSLPLRDYQLAGLNWLVHAWCRHNGVILADEMGLGKTIQTISFVSYLMNTYQCYGPYLIVVPLSTIVTWHLEFKKWAPEINAIVYIGDISSRQMIRDHEWQHAGNKRLKFNVLITTYEILLKDKSFLGGVTWAMLGVDEAHRLKNDDSLLYKSLIGFDTYHRMLITGTPLQNSLKELWSLLHFIMPEKFQEWDEFEEKHSDADKTGFAKLHKELEPYLLRRVKKDVEKSLPSKTEQILRVELSKTQKQYYKWILTKNYRALSKGVKGSIGSFINLIMELKKCCNHSFLVRLLDEEDEMGKDRLEVIVKNSGKLILLDKLLLRLKESGHRVLIFSQMVRMLDILAEYLQLRRFQFQRLDGTMRGDLRRQAIDHFNAEDSSDFCFLLSTRAGGLGVNLATADTVIIFDSDWNPQNDLQAQARAHRIGQKKQVSVYRLVTKGSVEEDIVERAKKKMVLDHLVIQRMDTTGRTVLGRSNATSTIGSNNPFNKDELNAILKFGAEELFKDDEEDDGELQVDLDQILNRAETREMEEDNNVGSELLAQFKVVSFDNLEDEELERTKGSSMQKLWEDIIPEDERKKIEEEDEQQKLQEMNLGPRERKQVTDLNKILESDGEDRRSKRKKKKDESESEEQDLSDDDSDDDRPKSKRGRPKGGSSKKQPVKGFTNLEIRSFVKSYKKFATPSERLDAVAGDAELNEKSHSDLKKLAEHLHSMCETAMKEHEEKKEEEKEAPGEVKKPSRDRGPSFKIGSVTVNAKQTLQAEQDLEPLAAVMSTNKAERMAYKIDFHVKSSHFDCPWDENDDASLLRGVYEYGMGSWEAIKMDPEFNLHDKILSDSNLKPQAKHLQTRIEYMLKLLRKQTGVEEPKQVVKKPRAKKKQEVAVKATVHDHASNSKMKSKEFVEDSDSSGDEKGEKDKENFQKGGSPKRKKKEKEKSPEMENNDEDMEEGEVKEEKSRKKKKKKKKSVEGPMHFTTHAAISVADEQAIGTELPKEIFSECKEKMRPVKKSLISLDNPDADLTEKEQLLHTRRCLLKIGDRINECLQRYKDPDVLKEWRNNLWMFVSKFTEFDASRLHKLYKHAVKKREEDKSKEEAKSSHTAHRENDNNVSQSHHSSQGDKHHLPHHGKKRPSDDRSYPRDRDDYRPPNKRMPPDTHSDTSRDSHSARPIKSNKRSSSESYGEVNRENQMTRSNYDRDPRERDSRDRDPSQRVDNYSHSGYKGYQGHPTHKDRFHEVKDEKWQVHSPLERPDEQDRRNRYDSNSYNRPPNSFRDRDRRDRNQHSGEYHPRYNKGHRKDYGDGGYGSNTKGDWPGGGDHSGRGYQQHNRGDFNRTDYRNARPDRPDYRQEHGFYGHRPPGDDGNPDERMYSERKKRPPEAESHAEWRGSTNKDPRLHGGGDTHHPPPVEHARSTPVDMNNSRPIPVISSPVPLMTLSPLSSVSSPQDYVNMQQGGH